MRILGALLIVFGIIAIAIPSFTFFTTERAVDAGPLQIDWKKPHTVVMNPLAGVAADRPEMTILDVRAQVCPDGTYQEEVDGIDLFRDGVHYSQEGARWLWGWLAGEIARVADEAA